MKIFTRKEKLTSGITTLKSSEKYIFVGSVDDQFKILDKNFQNVQQLKINFGTVDCKYKNNSDLSRIGH